MYEKKNITLIKVVKLLPHLEWIVILQPVSFIVIDKRNREKEREIEERDKQRDGNFIIVFSSLFHSRASQALGTCALLTSICITLTENRIIVKIAHLSTNHRVFLCRTVLWMVEKGGIFGSVQVNLCQKLLFLHQPTHNMTTDCSLYYKFNTWKFQAQTWGEHVVYRNCSECQKQFMYTTCSPQVWALNFHVHIELVI